MKFGLSLDTELQILNVHHERIADGGLRVHSLQRTQAYSPIRLLSETIRKLESLRLAELLETQRSDNLKNEALKNERKNKLMSDTIIDDEFNKMWNQLQTEVQRIIDNQKALKKQEEERLMKIKEEEERKRLEILKQKAKEEEEAQIKAQEKAKREAEQKARKAEEDAKRAEAERLKAEETKNKLKEKIRKEQESASRKSKGLTDFKEIEKQLVYYRQKIETIKAEVVEPMNKDKDLKRNINALKRKINIKFGQLSNSMTQLNQISHETVELVKQTSSNQLAYKWILNFIAKAIVSQAETEVTVKPTAALPLARLSMHLLYNLDGLYDFLCPRFVKKCCLIIGFTCPIDTEEGRIRMGWRRHESKWEPEVKYEERIGGICSVWAVMARLEHDSKFAFFSMDAEWKFAARMLNTEKSLLSNVHYVVVSNWWEAAAQLVINRWRKQGIKILQLFSRDWAKYGQEKSFPAATRLEVLGDDFELKNDLNQLKEMES